MLIKPSFVRNVPDGLAVTLLFPMGAGGFPATRRFETAHPIVARTESSIDTSMNVAVRFGAARAALIAIAAVKPPTVSARGYPTLYGPVSLSPVILITPDIPWIIWS